jgi:transcriptional regulator with XRE-family HTH domain
MSTPGDRIREGREGKGWTQEQLADKAQISKGFLSDVENNKRNVSAENALKIADALGMSLDYLMRGEDIRSEPARVAVSIPPGLSEAAQELGLSYSETLMLLEAHEAVVGRRSTKFSKERTIEDWKKLHQAIKDVYEDGSKTRK